jgi:hypothetical protein
MEVAIWKWPPRTTSHIFQKVTKGILHTKTGRDVFLSEIVQSQYLSE